MDEYRYEPGPDSQASLNNKSTNSILGKKVKEDVGATNSSDVSMTKVFIWLGIGLLITGVIAFGLPYLFTIITDGFTKNVESISKTVIALFIISIILMIPSAIVMAVKAGAKNAVAMKVGYFVYTIAMGMLLSTLLLGVYVLTYDPTDKNALLNPAFVSTVSMSFFITGGCFLIMAVIGTLTKHMNAAIPVVGTAFIGVIVMSIVNFFLRVEMIYWIIDFVVFAVVLLITAIDMHNIKKIVDSSKGALNGTNLAIYCAYCLYVDFINIFIRVLYYVLIIVGKNKR